MDCPLVPEDLFCLVLVRQVGFENFEAGAVVAAGIGVDPRDRTSGSPGNPDAEILCKTGSGRIIDCYTDGSVRGISPPKESFPPFSSIVRIVFPKDDPYFLFRKKGEVFSYAYPFVSYFVSKFAITGLPNAV